MRILFSAAMLFSLCFVLGCGGEPAAEPIEGTDEAEEITEEEEAAEIELDNTSGGDDV